MDSHFCMVLTALMVLRITYCYESPTRDIVAVGKIKTNPAKEREI